MKKKKDGGVFEKNIIYIKKYKQYFVYQWYRYFSILNPIFRWIGCFGFYRIYYCKILDSSDFFNFISKMVQCGITASTYLERANIILKQRHPDSRQLSTINLVVCDSTAWNVFQGMLGELPSVEELVTCSNKMCKNSKMISVMHLTYNTTGDLSELENVLSRVITESSMCG